ncbi:MAG: HlyC/CorC family transporter [Rikenellaceae bacterium]|nr:HlyC/CorC family transporter [Rikenellaceae bacterium]
MEIIIILLLIALNGVFAMSEIALISARKSKLETDARHGNRAAQTALRLIEKPDKFLSTIQIGITLIGILTGLYSGDVFAQDVGVLLVRLGVPAAYAIGLAKTLIVIVVTYLTIIFGELVPKRIGMTAAERAAKLIARPMHWLSVFASPFVWLLSKSTGLIFRLLKISEQESKVTEEEIKSLIRESTDDGEIDEVEQDIVERVFTLGDRNVSSIMTHRSDIVWLDLTSDNRAIRDLISNNLFDVYPVAEGTIDRIVGVVYLKDLFGRIDAPDFDLRAVLHQPQFFHESTSVYTALEQMKSSRVKYGLISDEFGDIQGMITLKDVLEALVGVMPDLGEEQEIIAREDGGWLVDGQCSFYDFLAYFDLEALYPEYDYNTLSGLILRELGHVPHTGETVDWQSFRLEIVDMDGARIDKVLVSRPGTGPNT